MGDLRDLVITPKTVGADIFDPLSAEEVACIKETAGESLYDIIRVTPIGAFTGDISQASFLFDCLNSKTS